MVASDRVVLVVTLTTGLLLMFRPDADAQPQASRANYAISVKFDPATRRLEGRERVRFRAITARTMSASRYRSDGRSRQPAGNSLGRRPSPTRATSFSMTLEDLRGQQAGTGSSAASWSTATALSPLMRVCFFNLNMRDRRTASCRR